MAPELLNIKETCLYVRDLEATRKFYESVMGLRPIHYQKGRHLFFRVGTDVLLFFNAEATAVDEELPRHFGSGEQHIAFECTSEDYKQWKIHLMQNGVRIEQEVEWPKGGQSFYFRDPDNLCLEIVERGIWGF
jgi:catechol 2,3-dioxygenase-like lactoylglutathione lyase family enzyme